MARFSSTGGSGNGSALNYVQVAGTQQTISTAPSGIIDLNITTTGKPVQISVTGEGANASAGSWLRLNLFRDEIEIGNSIQMESSAASENVPFAINFIDDVAAGTYNYSARVTSINGGNWTFGEASGPVMNAVELTGFKGNDGADGTDGVANLVVPTAIKDGNDADFITFEKTNTGTARIGTPQDDLSLRSARDITLYAGDDGPGNVYIGWGDAVYTPDSTNRVATIGDIQSANTGDITFVNNTISSETGDDIIIQNKTNSDVVTARMILNQNYPRVAMEAIDDREDWFNSGQWATATWTGNNVNFADAPDLVNYFSNTPGNITGISINNGTIMQWWGTNFGEGTISLNVSGTPAEDPETVTEMRVYYTITSKIDIDFDNGSFDLIARNMDINLESDDDIYITAGGDDLLLRANDDIRFSSRYNDPNLPEQQWRMNSEGQFEFPGDGYISNPSGSSGDGYGNDTLHLVPDSDLTFEGGDQYIVIDPTYPNHIHVRAGGIQDESFAELFLGAERTHVRVSDGSGDVGITSKKDDLINSYVNLNQDSTNYFVTTMDSVVEPNAVVNVDGLDYAVVNVQYDVPDAGYKTVEITGGTFTAGNNYTFRVADGENSWTFDSNGTLYGPEDGAVVVSGIVGEAGQNVFNILARENLVLNNGEGYGAYLNDSNSGLNQIATIGDLNNLASGEVSFTVNGGSLGTMPTFDGAPLFSGTYVKTGPMVHFQIQVDMDNITSFGTGQYYIDLPFDAKYGYQFKEGCLHDISTSNQFAIGGHVAAGTSRLFLTYTGSNGQDELFDHDSPVNLNAADNFHISGTYITQ